MSERILAYIVLAALSTAGCVGSAADGPNAASVGASSSTGVQMDGTGCRELIVLSAVPAQVARSFVPDRYTIATEPAGVATVFAGLKVCENLILNGTAVGPASTSDVGVMIEAPDGTDGIHYYQTWWGTNNAALHQRLDAQGWRAFLTNGQVIDDERIEGLAGPATATVPWSEGDYVLSAEVATGPVPGEVVGTGWYVNDEDDELAVAKVLSSSVQGNGVGTVTAPPGSPTAGLFDGTEVPGAALFNVYEMTGTVGPTGN